MRSAHFAFIPALIVTALILLSAFAFVFCQIYTATQLPLLPWRSVIGLDFRDFWEAGKQVMAGSDIYANSRYVTPPLGAHFFQLFAPLEAAEAVQSYMLITFCSYVFGILLMAYSVLSQKNFSCFWAAIITIVSGILSYPLLFLLERGNIDGLVLFTTALTLFFWNRHQMTSGAMLALATSLKVYPVILLCALILEKRWKAVTAFFVAQSVIIALDFDRWSTFVTDRLLTRANIFFYADNVSFAAAHYYVRKIVIFILGQDPILIDEISYAGITGGITFLLLFIAALYIHKKFTRIPSLVLAGPLLYLPLMIGVPLQVYSYSQVILLPLLFLFYSLWDNAYTLRQQIFLSMLCVCFGASLIHPWPFSMLSQGQFFFGIPSVTHLLCTVSLYIYLIWYIPYETCNPVPEEIRPNPS